MHFNQTYAGAIEKVFYLPYDFITATTTTDDIIVTMMMTWCSKINNDDLTWWRHQMETFSALLALCAGNSPVTGEFTSQRPVTRSLDAFFDLRLNKRCQAIIWTNAGMLFIGPSGTKFREMLIEIYTFSFKKMHLRMSSGKWRPFCLRH